MSKLPVAPTSRAKQKPNIDENKQIIPLVGEVSRQIVGVNLPSKRQVLQVMFFHLRVGRMTKRESARLAVREIKTLWEQARIPHRAESRCIEKIEALHNKWSTLRKNTQRKSKASLNAEQDFMEDLNNLFDIASADALQKIENPKDREYLELQRRRGQSGDDTKAKAQKDKAADNKQKMVARKKKKRGW